MTASIVCAIRSGRSGGDQADGYRAGFPPLQQHRRVYRCVRRDEIGDGAAVEGVVPKLEEAAAVFGEDVDDVSPTTCRTARCRGCCKSHAGRRGPGGCGAARRFPRRLAGRRKGSCRCWGCGVSAWAAWFAGGMMADGAHGACARVRVIGAACELGLQRLGEQEAAADAGEHDFDSQVPKRWMTRSWLRRREDRVAGRRRVACRRR